jgi:hypothetical protein
MENLLQLLRRRVREEVSATCDYLGAAIKWEEYRAHEGASTKIASCEEQARKHAFHALRLSLIMSSIGAKVGTKIVPNFVPTGKPD